MSSGETYHIIPEACHDALVVAAFTRRGYDEEESSAMARLCRDAARHGIRTHNAIKALHLDSLFGSRVGGCRPCARVVERPCRFPAARSWGANHKLGPPAASKA